MASLKAFLAAIAIAVTVVAPVMSKDFTVGDDDGWKLNVNYTAWAEGKEFHVGDRLVFKYTVGSHNVLKANQSEFQQCQKPNLTTPYTTGNDIIPLASPGKKWYFCGVKDHCENGKMKLVINVLSQIGAPAPAPNGTPGSSVATGIAPSMFFSCMIAVFAIFRTIKA